MFSVFSSPATCNLQCMSKTEPHLTFSQSLCNSALVIPWRWTLFAANLRNNIIIWGGINSIWDLFVFICSVTLLNLPFIENHIQFIHIDANPAKFNTRCLLPWIWDTEQTTEPVAEKQQRSFHCQIARASGTVYGLSMKHSQKTN